MAEYKNKLKMDEIEEKDRKIEEFKNHQRIYVDKNPPRSISPNVSWN